MVRECGEGRLYIAYFKKGVWMGTNNGKNARSTKGGTRVRYKEHEMSHERIAGSAFKGGDGRKKRKEGREERKKERKEEIDRRKD